MTFDPNRLIALIGKQAEEIEQLRKENKYLVHTDEDIKVQNAEIERLRAEIIRLNDDEIKPLADSYDSNTAEIVRLRAALSRLLLNYSAALPEGKKDQRSIAEARKLLGLGEQAEPQIKNPAAGGRRGRRARERA